MEKIKIEDSGIYAIVALLTSIAFSLVGILYQIQKIADSLIK